MQVYHHWRKCRTKEGKGFQKRPRRNRKLQALMNKFAKSEDHLFGQATHVALAARRCITPKGIPSNNSHLEDSRMESNYGTRGREQGCNDNFV
jgi:hypothetical protein